MVPVNHNLLFLAITNCTKANFQISPVEIKGLLPFRLLFGCWPLTVPYDQLCLALALLGISIAWH